VTFTVVVRNKVLGTSRGCGAWDDSTGAAAYAQREAERSRSFCVFEVWRGTPRNPIAPVDGMVFAGLR
jgi:hypothetical protein